MKASEATLGAEAVDNLLRSIDPAPTTRGAPIKGKPAAMIDRGEVGERESWDAMPVRGEGDAPPGPVVMPSVRPAVSVPGLPSLEDIHEVRVARANVAKVAEQRAAAEAELLALETSLGLKPGASAREVEKLAVELLAAGKSDSPVQKFEALRVRVRRLVSAEQMNAEALAAAIAEARRVLSPKAVEVELKPVCRRVGLALLALLAALAEEHDARGRLRLAGFSQPSGTIPPDGVLDPWSNPVVAHLVREGHLSRAEVKAACPHMNGY